MPPLTRWAVARFSDRTNRRGCVEWRCALRAKSGFGWVLETALFAKAPEGSCALNAELRALGFSAEQFWQRIDLPVEPSD